MQCEVLLPDPTECCVAYCQEEQLELELARQVDEPEQVEDDTVVCKDDVGRECTEEDQGEQEGYVAVDGLPIGRTNAEDDCDDDVLEGGDEEECRVLVADCVELVRVDEGWFIPASRKKKTKE